uniref:Uncharacterized protein n=1 Tax=Rhizophora mucronata TaxID=61149 RepID=A0A2P2NXE8_RHIMU
MLAQYACYFGFLRSIIRGRN